MQTLELRKTIVAKAWLVPGPAHYMARCDSDCAWQALPPGEHPSIPSLHHLLLGWHKHFSSCMTCILPTSKQQAGPSLSKQLLPVATQAQEFPMWSPKKHSSHFFAAIAWPDCRNQAPDSLISLAKHVPATSCASIRNLLWLHESLFPADKGVSREEDTTWMLERVGSQLVLCQIQRWELLKTPKKNTPRNTVTNSLRTEPE